MSTYVADEIDSLIKTNEGPDSVDLLIGVREGYLENVKEQIRYLDAENIEELPFNSLAVSVPKSTVQTICGFDGIESIELNEGMEVLEGN